MTKTPTRTGGSPGTRYAAATLVAALPALAIRGWAPEAVAGVAVAWSIQAVAFGRLSWALTNGRDASRIWLAGIGARFAGLAAVGAPALAGWTTSTLPAAYGVAMLALLLLEGIWLIALLPKDVSGALEPRYERTNSTG